MKKGRWTFLIMVLALAFTAGCGTAQREPEKTEKEEEDKLQIGLSFDSFVIERWLRDRDMFVSTAQSLGAEVNVQVAGGVSYTPSRKMGLVFRRTAVQALPAGLPPCVTTIVTAATLSTTPAIPAAVKGSPK